MRAQSAHRISGQQIHSQNGAQQGEAAKPLVLTETVDQTQKVYAPCPHAFALGLRAGMTLAEARAIHPALATSPANREADAESLQKLARFMVRYSPLVSTDGKDGLLIDATGCAHLFGGEANMLESMTRLLQKAGITACAAMAETVGAAWALARYRRGSITDSTTSLKALEGLPVRALRLDEASITTLGRLGLKTIGSLTSLPRASLAKRFRGNPAKAVTALLEKLDQTLGRRDEPINPLVPLPEWQVRQAFMEPAQHLEMIEHALTSLAEDLATVLMEAGRGAKRLIFSAYRVDGTVEERIVGISKPSRDAAHFMRLLDEKIKDLDAGFGFDLIMLAALESERLAPSQIGDLRQEEAQAAAKLMDKLAARLGPGSVAKLKHYASHMPERAQQITSASEENLGWADYRANKNRRPMRLLPRPEAVDVLSAVPEGAPKSFRWRRVDHKVIKAEGPERIACEWWLNPHDSTRDYYRVEVSTGARFWLFRHGLYGVPGVRPGESQQPHWYVHGFFA
ncbi:Y-family DNA polymerase [Kordiimonas sp.]|uniref:Y-family DNA polymerase n=1 Tax=Kordiimonas sp. TaxID=1970157 RepID=UPI003A8ECC37